MPSLCSEPKILRSLGIDSASLYSLAESIPWNRYLASLKVYKFRLWTDIERRHELFFPLPRLFTSWCNVQRIEQTCRIGRHYMAGLCKTHLWTVVYSTVQHSTHIYALTPTCAHVQLIKQHTVLPDNDT